MTLIVFLRMLSDMGLYCTFVGVLMGLFGARPIVMLGGLLLLSVAVTVSFVLREHGFLRYLPLILTAICWLFFADKFMEKLFLLLVFLYTIKVVRSIQFFPTWERQSSLFSRYWKLAIIFLVVGEIFSAMISSELSLINTVAVPSVLVTCASQFLLLRSLRHDQDIYSQHRHQLIDVILIVFMLGIAAFLSSKPVLNASIAGVTFTYRSLIRPLGKLILQGLELIMWSITWLAAKIFKNDIPLELPTISDMETLAEDNAESALDPPPNSNLPIFAIPLILLAIIGAATLLFLLFRRLTQQTVATDKHEARQEERLTISMPNDQPKAFFRPGTPIQRIRQQYRRYLQLCGEKRIIIKHWNTSEDIEKLSENVLYPEAVHNLRQIYISARYNDIGTKDDADAAEKAYKQLKENKSRKQ